MQNKLDSVSYAIGMDIGVNLKSQSIDVAPAALAKGIIDYLSGNGTILTDEVKTRIINEFQTEHTQRQMEMEALRAQRNIEEGRAFLEENKTKEGVRVTESGLQYKIIREGTGLRPTAASSVTVHYEGKLIDGTIFDSSYQRDETITFPLSGVIPGWTEGLQLLKEGGEAILYIPSELGYGERGAGQVIPGNATLIFKVELFKVE
ncbi:MAG: FKBP-type peptidyl-prolyl cis-trans isomerase [Bacteroidales bacterium]|nr:FKBP-type peptidyl-prolyl cis-trans isomerase [Bacteroidales bacterium]